MTIAITPARAMPIGSQTRVSESKRRPGFKQRTLPANERDDFSPLFAENRSRSDAKRVSVPEALARSACALTERSPRSLFRRPAGQPGPRQRPRGLARGALGGGGRRNRDLGRGRRLGAKDLLLRLALEQRLARFLLGRLPLDQDLA